ncbi:spondin domain-containing protein [Paraglaciecola arctica]|uniref:spondin domain-containing protein n=1 Tax=Paraglaciecola arctica TaxID=1128911 RepID=UPI001C07A4F7|nr:spondin domain-containing protein [Paraglaciecola arctica]MBU3005922.1 spondin domain-containing protein [Paraglaciecola arctica]
MIKRLKLTKKRLAILVGMPILLSACSDDEVEVIKEVEVIVEVPAPVPEPVDVSYEVTVTNLTNAQPLSPVAVVLHANGHLFSVGEVPSVDLEKLAEGGMNAGLLALGEASATGAGAIAPGASETISVTIEDVTTAKLSVVTMLVNTNDAFSGLDALDLSDFAVGDSWTATAGVYDAGTEVNTEAVGSIPGPADGGEGFNAIRIDTGYVAMHPGVVTVDDGLSDSVLTIQHKFDNPALRIMVTRIE